MRINSHNNNVVLTEISDFNLTHIFECGQCFRWNVNPDGSYTGVARNKPLRIKAESNTATLFDTSLDGFNNIWYHYFDFETDYAKIKERLSGDEVLRTAIPFGNGIRILRQELWETVVSFIISASNNIPRIKKIVEALCLHFGTRIEYENQSYYTFPDCHTLASLNISELSVIRAGFRDKYILDAARKFSSGQLSFDLLSHLTTPDAKKALLDISGVGSKVADCILLFGLSRTDTFPVDVWVKRIMENLYLKRDAKNPEIESFAREKFGSLSGLAQQYLFFYARETLSR